MSTSKNILETAELKVIYTPPHTIEVMRMDEKNEAKLVIRFDLHGLAARIDCEEFTLIPCNLDGEPGFLVRNLLHMTTLENAVERIRKEKPELLVKETGCTIHGTGLLSYSEKTGIMYITTYDHNIYQIDREDHKKFSIPLKSYIGTMVNFQAEGKEVTRIEKQTFHNN